MSKKAKGSRVTLRRDSPVIQGLFKEVRYKLTGIECGKLSHDNLLYLKLCTGIGKRSLQEYFGDYAARTVGISISTADLLAKFIRKESFEEFAEEFYSPKNPSNPVSIKAPLSQPHKFIDTIIDQICYKLICNKLLAEDLFRFIQNQHPQTQKNINIENGIDFFVTSSQNSDIEMAFCVLDFGNEGLEQKQLRIVRDQIKKVKSINQNINSFILICNCRYTTEQYNELMHEIRLLEKEQNIKSARLYDIRAFITNSLELITMEIRKKILESNKAFKVRYQKKVNQHFYMEEVPFKTDNNDKIQSNLLEFLTQEARKNMKASPNTSEQTPIHTSTPNLVHKQHWNFIISEFGLGKTSLLLNLAEQLNNNNIPSLFLPLSQFDYKAFNSKKALYQSILNILNAEIDFELNDHYKQLQLAALQELLERNNEMILLFDGLDEHQSAYQADSLEKIFQCIDKTQSQIIISLRKEFWDDQQGNLKAALCEIEREKRFAILTQWADTEIISYISNQLKIDGLSDQSKKKLLELKAQLQSNIHKNIYGDILTRPFFLSLLTQEILTRPYKKTNKGEHFEEFLIKRFELDRKTIFGTSKRSPLQLELSEDRNKILGKIFVCLEQVAELIHISHIKTSTKTIQSISESQLENTIDHLRTKELNLSELLQNSILISEDIRTIAGINLKFPHTSLQNYFHARYIYHQHPTLSLTDSIFTQSFYSKEVIEFLKELIQK